ncbi:MAG TPA: hypothetical protein VKW06_13400 [Candidatus Angelobacter sp.]|nr:hypothetical protein [Candidatus Angelobacter sp.]
MSSVGTLQNSVQGRGRTYIVLILFLIGLYIPTSSQGVQSSALVALTVPLFVIGLMTLLFLNGMGSYWLRAIGCCIPVVLVLSSLVSPFPITEGGPIYSYTMLGLLYASNLKVQGSESYPVLSKGLLAVNLVSLILGLGIILQYEPIMNFLVAHYTYFYADLLPIMFSMRKPVLTFGTHSVAGFFVFLLFWMNLRTYEARKNVSSLCFLFVYPVFSLFLFSFTSLAFLVWELAFLLRLGLQRRWKLTLAAILILGSVGVALAGRIDKDLRQQLADYALSALQSQGNGVLGRYSASTGDLAGDLAFLHDHPWQPVGLTGSKNLFFVDSGPVEYLLRGSLPLLLLIYSGMVGFFLSNLRNKKDAFVTIAAILTFEVGFSILPFARMLFSLPFFIAYLNALQGPLAQTHWRSSQRFATPSRPLQSPPLALPGFET